MKALRILEAEGQIVLPTPQCDLRISTPQLLDAPVPEVPDVPSDLRLIQDLEIVLVRSAQQRAVWNTPP